MTIRKTENQHTIGNWQLAIGNELVSFSCPFTFPIANSPAQSVSFDLKTNPTVDFTFNTIQKYQTGIIVHDAVILDVVVPGTQWDLYVGSSTAVAGTWDNVQYYSTDGNSNPLCRPVAGSIQKTAAIHRR